MGRVETIGDCTLYCGDALAVLRELSENSVDTVITDPPYELGFMGKSWDAAGVSFHPETWAAVLRVAKPGAIMLCFGGTRTFHRIACAIEDAGWELRDTMMYVFGSGFPKSLDIEKTIDKAARGFPQGTNRSDPLSPNAGKFKTQRTEGKRDVGDKGQHFGAGPGQYMAEAGVKDDRTITTPEALPWHGYGTALKPAVEYIICAQKPLDLRGICDILALKIGEALCQIQSSVSAAAKSSPSSRAALGVERDSALWNAVKRSNTSEGLSDLMAMSRSGLEKSSCLSTALSWLDLLGAISTSASTFTTATATSLTTDLKTLNSLPSMIIADGIIAASTGALGTGSNACLVASIFTVASAKLASTLTPSALGLVTSPDGASALRPDWLPIIVAMKPLDGTFAENAQKWGVAGLNIDGGRIPFAGPADESEAKDKNQHADFGSGPMTNQVFGEFAKDRDNYNAPGRWPANVIHDGSEEVLAGFPETGPSPKTYRRKMAGYGWNGKIGEPAGKKSLNFGDSGSAARFFYCAKASRSERDAGCEELASKTGAQAVDRKEGTAGLKSPRAGAGRSAQSVKNSHPTVKPLALMRYLARLTATPTGGIVLDLFAGSGTTLVACLAEGRPCIGIEMEEAYIEIAKCRIAEATKQGNLFTPPVKPKQEVLL